MCSLARKLPSKLFKAYETIELIEFAEDFWPPEILPDLHTQTKDVNKKGKLFQTLWQVHFHDQSCEKISSSHGNSWLFSHSKLSILFETVPFKKDDTLYQMTFCSYFTLLLIIIIIIIIK